jgi:hypothetical protein
LSPPRRRKPGDEQRDPARVFAERARALLEAVNTVGANTRAIAKIDVTPSRLPRRVIDRDPDDDPPGRYHPSDDLPPVPVDDSPGPAPVEGKPRHREADAFPMTTIERLDELLAERQAALDAGRTADGPLTLGAIAGTLSALPPEFRWTHTRVWRAQVVRNLVLEAKGWDLPTLLRSRPEFRADNGLWRLPTIEKAHEYWG